MALELYKPDEATRWRGGLSAVTGGLLLYGIVSLYDFLAIGFWVQDYSGGALGDEFPLSPRLFLCGVLTLIVAVGVYLLANHKKIVEFLILTEKEMEKVSWPAKHEVISSSIAVCVTTVIMAIYLGLVDFGLVKFKETLWPKILGAILGTEG
jgi:preprotein translocase subunit SecE